MIHSHAQYGYLYLLQSTFKSNVSPSCEFLDLKNVHLDTNIDFLLDLEMRVAKMLNIGSHFQNGHQYIIQNS